MSHDVCPWWLGYALLNPLRRLREDPSAMLAPWVREGMTVLEPGCGMGFFTLEIARRVGAGGRVVAIDVQERMLRRLRTRAARAGLADRVDARLAHDGTLGVADLAGRVDFCLAVHMVHEVPDAAAFLRELFAACRPGAALVVVELSWHVTEAAFEATLAAAESAGFALARRPLPSHPRSAELRRR